MDSPYNADRGQLIRFFHILFA